MTGEWMPHLCHLPGPALHSSRTPSLKALYEDAVLEGVIPRTKWTRRVPRPVLIGHVLYGARQIYLDDSFRMAKDSRGVLLVVEKLS